MKPSFALCFFKNSSLNALRTLKTSAMSTSLKVVNIAVSFLASTKRSATFLLNIESLDRF